MAQNFSDLTLEKFEGIIKDVLFKPVDENKDIKIGQICITNGFGFRTISNPNICNNPECKSCRELDKVFKEEFKNI